MNRSQRFPRRQGGLVLILVVVGMTSLIAMAGLALDFGFAFLTKTRIQNALDAAALSGAKTLAATDNTTLAKADATATFQKYANQLSLPISTIPKIDFSASYPGGFGSGVTAGDYIRVRLPDGYTIPTFLIGVLPSVGKTLAPKGSAIAGRVQIKQPDKVCGLVPLVVWDKSGGTDSDCSDGTCFGYKSRTPTQNGDVIALKGTSQNDSPGPGNFGLLDLAGSGDLDEAVGAGLSNCISNTQTVPTKPGNNEGPFRWINTRFGTYEKNAKQADPTDYPKDINVKNWDNYSAYLAAINNNDYVPPSATVAAGRRLITVVFSNFAKGDINGKKQIPVSGFGCFFLLSPADKVSGSDQIMAEFTTDCPLGDGVPTSVPPNSGASYKIVLYNDQEYWDS